LLCQELDIDMASFTPFIPRPFTPYQNHPKTNIDLVYKTIAIARIMLKTTHIHACNSIDDITSNGREIALKVGANIIIPDLSITAGEKTLFPPGKIKRLLDNAQSITNKIENLGFHISTGKGNSLKIKALLD